MANGDEQDDSSQVQDEVPVTEQPQLQPPPQPQPVAQSFPGAVPIARVPPGMAQTYSTLNGVQSPVSTFIAGPRPPTDPRAELYRRQQQSNEALWRNLQQRTANMPLAQTEAAVSAAMRFQGQRQYQRDLAAGVPQAEAFARAAPLMFNAPRQGNIGQAGAFVRAVRPQPPPRVMTLPGGQQVLVHPNGTATVIPAPKAAAAAKPSTLENEDYRIASQELAKEFTALRKIEDLGSPEAQRARNRIRTLQADIEAIRSKYGGAAAPPAQATPAIPRATAAPPSAKRVRVRNPSGKVGTIPESQLEAAKAAGYTEAQ